jgi:nitric oxide reductase subunit C
VARGIEIYRANFCGTCHTLDVAGTHGIFGPTHNGVATTAAQRVQQPGYTGAATTAEGYIRESLRDPNIYHVPGYSGGRFSMPVFTDLDPADLDALVYMLLQQK